jgi:DNA-binding transcriptional MerR regulator
MNKFSIKAVERLSGIKAHTLRVWEQRYGIVQPSRKQSKHRYYTNDDLKALLKVVFLYKKGHKIRSLAALNQEALDTLIQEQPNPSADLSLALMQAIEAVLDLDEVRFDCIINSFARQYGFEYTMVELLFPLLNRIGMMWLTDNVVPGQEHFTSHLITRKILKAIDDLEGNKLQRKGLVMMFNPPGEFHEIPLLFMHYLLRRNGYQTIYLGSNVAPPALESFCQRHQPTHLFVHMTANLQPADPSSYLLQLSEQFPGVTIVSGGPVIRRLNFDGSRIVLLKTDDDLMEFSKDIYRFSAPSG